MIRRRYGSHCEVADETKGVRHLPNFELLGTCGTTIQVDCNAGYYDVDVEATVTAHEHRVIFSTDDIEYLIAIALAEKRYWTALVPNL